MLQHYILLKYKPNTDNSHIEAFCTGILALKDKIKEIQYIEVGRDELKQGRSWDIILIMRFLNVDDLDVYRRHPEHVKIMQFNDPFVQNIAAIDFTV